MSPCRKSVHAELFQFRLHVVLQKMKRRVFSAVTKRCHACLSSPITTISASLGATILRVHRVGVLQAEFLNHAVEAVLALYSDVPAVESVMVVGHSLGGLIAR